MTTRLCVLGDPLSARELQVVDLAADGLTNAGIAAALGLSDLTVKSHMARVASKSGTGDRAGIVAAAYRSGRFPATRTGVAPAGFGPRLAEVLAGIADGLSNAEIGVRLGLSEGAVKSRVKLLFRVLGVADRAAAVRAGVRCGVWSPARPVLAAAVPGPAACLLSDSELLALRLAAEGVDGAGVAAALGVSLALGQGLLRSAAARLGVRGRAGAVGAAYRVGVLAVPPVTGRMPEGFTADLHAVLAGMARGWSNREIARSLGTSAAGVDWLSRRLFGVLGVRDRAAAVHAGVLCGALRLVPRAVVPGQRADGRERVSS